MVPLAHELIRQNHHYRLYCYVPPGEVGGLGSAGVRYLTQRSFHKYLNPPSYGWLWHATSQAELVRAHQPVYEGGFNDSRPQFFARKTRRAHLRAAAGNGASQHSTR
ncbi:MAG: hypothetical protein WKG07_09655 [Hymenobacter sp.]